MASAKVDHYPVMRRDGSSIPTLVAQPTLEYGTKHTSFSGTFCRCDEQILDGSTDRAPGNARQGASPLP